MRIITVTFLLIFASSCIANGLNKPDDLLWLEEIKSSQSTEWVEKQNSITLKTFASTKNYKSTEQAILDTYNSPNKLRRISYIGDELMYIDSNSNNPKGVLYAMTKIEAKKKEPKWRKLIDFDALSKKEDRYLTFTKPQCNPYNPKQCMIGISIKGGDKWEFREFDLNNNTFVKNGFFIPEGIVDLDWLSRDTLVYTTTYNEKHLSKSGYSLVVRKLVRGKKAEQAEEIFRAKEGVYIIPKTFKSGQDYHSFITLWRTFDDADYYYFNDGKYIKINIPQRAEIEGVHGNIVLFKLLTDWKVENKKYKTGSLVGIDISSIESGDYKTELVFKPASNQVLNDVTVTNSMVSLLVLEDIQTQVIATERNANSGKWSTEYIKNPATGSVRIWSANHFNEEAIVMIRGFVNPTAMYFMNPKNNTHRLWEKSPEDFDTKELSHEYYFATDENGVKIPYQVVGPKNRDPNKKYPTLMYVYGGHGVARTAWYRADIGLGWLEKGGVFVVANVRGGGAYGTPWHQAAVRTKKHQTIDDIATVSKDLFRRNITNSRKLGVYGVSSGGFSACSTLVRYPELINAAICKAPLTDMMRYTQLFAGKSWITEYGDPEDPVEGEYWLNYSPYHNVKADEDYPTPLLIAWKNDDRVHPGHARRMVAKMHNLGLDAYYYESPEGGHGGGAGSTEKARIRALEYEYFRQRLFD